MGDLNTRLKREQGVQLAVRVGIHTGLVVIGEMGGAGRQEQLALGEVPNLAARIQGIAAPNTVAISEATSRLVQGYFTCEALGGQTLGYHVVLSTRRRDNVFSTAYGEQMADLVRQAALPFDMRLGSTWNTR
jgi:class 3 adenylate cyclase